MTKTRGGASNTSRLATHIEYKTRPGTDVTGVRNIGGPTVESMMDGVEYANIQSAIDELQTLTSFPINGIYVSDAKQSPEGVRQAETLTFSGVVVDTESGKAVVKVYGVPFIVDAGTNADVVCNQVLAKFEEMRDANILFASVNRVAGTTTPIIEIQFIDTATHVNIENFDSYGITVAREVTVPGVPGFGVWDYLGEESKTLAGGSLTGPTQLYYFKRIG
ncbi:baseplate wedge protein [Aeromonas phage B614]|nr:baseplate wedge protein [Aeromonas phage B614]UYD58249.1 baseplate wedge protein [Aeromonas phage UP87]UYD58363.1 baseplate wedge protein [Aeromonas phage avDM14-QBC]UYD58827.1 baseplate wedge protein [Aeromonas phage avDM10-HWA]UYD58870.1 baseplate wedge protein [Aeromonas phage avDM7-IJDJ]UYD59930.1 baseplate wedge protein [Aeromonas phage avDM9-HANS]